MVIRHNYNIGYRFAEIAEKCPQRPAIRFLDGATVTYAEMDCLSNRLAGFLTHADGRQNGGEKRVACILNGKTAFSYAAMLAALKSGTIYANIDAGSPVPRLRKMLETCGAGLLFCSDAMLGKAKELCRGLAVELVNCDAPTFREALADFADEPPPQMAEVHGGSPAYIMFTSGSTGFPKGAVITHGGLLNFIEWSRSTFDISQDDILTNVNPMHFDNSVFDFFSSLFTGASIVPVPERRLKQPRALLDALNPMNCTIWFSVPSLLVYMLKMRALKEGDLPGLRKILFGGEGFPKAQLRKLHATLGDRVDFVNVYGPTECTCICSSYAVKETDLESPELLPLGAIAPSFDYLIINGDGTLPPEGEVGELCLLGPNVGMGYYRSPELTARSFIQNPLHNDYRDITYKTGDLVRLDTKTGYLHFVGRKDNQIKRMGYRIELEEIEIAIGGLDYVHECGAVFDRSNDPGRIVTYVSAECVDEITLLDDLQGLLPPYMIPNQVVFLDGLPKNQNGKVDRKALVAKLEKGEQ